MLLVVKPKQIVDVLIDVVTKRSYVESFLKHVVVSRREIVEPKSDIAEDLNDIVAKSKRKVHLRSHLVAEKWPKKCYDMTSVRYHVDEE
ncbi:MAG: hypothetical protein CL920_10490 [Deltaproteobacteria bacterium]|nr:hypothetical protein [Deltaproteobacteria bacterium]|tara:strand:+ start:408 stop:674 length:267 start_codon:yes stop_codon:yes gene_type:complete